MSNWSHDGWWRARPEYQILTPIPVLGSRRRSRGMVVGLRSSSTRVSRSFCELNPVLSLLDSSPRLSAASLPGAVFKHIVLGSSTTHFAPITLPNAEVPNFRKLGQSSCNSRRWPLSTSASEARPMTSVRHHWLNAPKSRLALSLSPLSNVFGQHWISIYIVGSSAIAGGVELKLHARSPVSKIASRLAGKAHTLKLILADATYARGIPRTRRGGRSRLHLPDGKSPRPQALVLFLPNSQDQPSAVEAQTPDEYEIQ